MFAVNSVDAASISLLVSKKFLNTFYKIINSKPTELVEEILASMPCLL
jgi:hypothetical protein